MYTKALSPSWDLYLVLRVLMQSPFMLIESCLLWFLMLNLLKLVFLTANTLTRRVSEIASFSCRESFCVVLKDKVVLRLSPSFKAKMVSSFHETWKAVLLDFPHDLANLHQKDFSQRSEKVRKVDNLFI